MESQYNNFLKYQELSKEQVSSAEAGKRLILLNKLADKFIGKALKEVYKAETVKKIATSYVGCVCNEYSKYESEYGHIKADDKKFRISTCLNKQTQSVQIPVSEESFWKDDTYLFFTTGDLFLTVKTSNLNKVNRYITDNQNYNYNIAELFINNAIDKFGVVDNGILKFDNKSVDLSSIEMLKNFSKFKLRGCTTSFDKNYCLIREKGPFFCEIFSSLEGIRKRYEDVSSSQYLCRIAKNNSHLFMDNTSDSDTREKATKVSIHNNNYVLVSLKELDFNALKDRINKEQTAIENEAYRMSIENSKECSLKKAVYTIENNIKSKEEYDYYRDIVKNWKNTFGTISVNRCKELKSMKQYKKFTYKKGVNYTYYNI